MNEIQVSIANTAGVAGEYAMIIVGPVLDPKSNDFIGILQVRRRGSDHQWINEFDRYAFRTDMGCTQQKLRRILDNTFDLASSSMTIWQGAPNGELWAYFGCAKRNPNTAAFEPYIMNVKF